VLRCFEDPDITLSGESIDPLADYEIIVSELMLKDLESAEKRIEKIHHSLKSAKNKPAEAKVLNDELALLEKVKTALDAGDADSAKKALNESTIETVPLLCAKNFLILANISESEIDQHAYRDNKHYQSLVETFGHDRVIPISAKLESELSQLSHDEAEEAMSMFGLETRGLDTIIQKTYQNLGLITFFTCGPKEIHAWPIEKGMKVRQAAGEIHSDLERGFICADVFNCADLFELKTESAVKSGGKLRTEGQDYIVQDGDIINVKFNV